MSNFDTIQLDVGELFLHYGEPEQKSVGFTQGGTFTDGFAIRSIEVDGKRAPVKGDKVVDTTEPVITFNTLQMEADLIDELFTGMTVVDNAGQKTLTRALTIVDADYLDNVTWVGTTKAGKSRGFKLKNALGFGPMNFTIADKTEIQIPCSFMAHNDSITDTTLPVEYLFDETA